MLVHSSAVHTYICVQLLHDGSTSKQMAAHYILRNSELEIFCRQLSPMHKYPTCSSISRPMPARNPASSRSASYQTSCHHSRLFPRHTHIPHYPILIALPHQLKQPTTDLQQQLPPRQSPAATASGSNSDLSVARDGDGSNPLLAWMRGMEGSTLEGFTPPQDSSVHAAFDCVISRLLCSLVRC